MSHGRSHVHAEFMACSQGLPFCVAGTGDLLALFRCISCRYCFGTDVGAPLMLGAPGRVFTSSEVMTRPFLLCSGGPAGACAVHCHRQHPFAKQGCGAATYRIITL